MRVFLLSFVILCAFLAYSIGRGLSQVPQELRRPASAWRPPPMTLDAPRFGEFAAARDDGARDEAARATTRIVLPTAAGGMPTIDSLTDPWAGAQPPLPAGPRWTSDIQRKPMQRLLAAVAALEEAGDSPPAWSEAIGAAADMRRWDALADIAGARLQERPDDEALRFERATALMRMKSWAQAISELRAILDSNPTHARAWHNLALSQQALGRASDARECWSRLLELSPDNRDARARRAEAAVDMKDWEAAAPDFARLIRENPDDTGARMNLSMALRELDRLEEAVRAVEPVLDGFPAHLPALNRLAELNWFHYLKEPARQSAARDAALRYCRRSLAISPTQTTVKALQDEILASPLLH